MITNAKLSSEDELTKLVTSKGVNTWKDLINYVQLLPYGRNKNRQDLELVIIEGKGTCSSKHALLKSIANLNSIADVQLVLGIYKMSEINTPGIAPVLSEHSLEFIPEAHCYLKIHQQAYDFTKPNADFVKIKDDILLEKEINPEQVNQFKVDFHQAYLRNWLKKSGHKLSFSELWKIREKCILRLSEKSTLRDTTIK